jgi:hypothetical protein
MASSKSRVSAEAMVKPTPRVPSGKPAKPDQMKLIKVLELLGNDRAYTVISQVGKTWLIQFEGDVGPTTITFEGENPEIK